MSFDNPLFWPWLITTCAAVALIFIAVAYRKRSQDMEDAVAALVRRNSAMEEELRELLRTRRRERRERVLGIIEGSRVVE